MCTMPDWAGGKTRKDHTLGGRLKRIRDVGGNLRYSAWRFKPMGDWGVYTYVYALKVQVEETEYRQELQITELAANGPGAFGGDAFGFIECEAFEKLMVEIQKEQANANTG